MHVNARYGLTRYELLGSTVDPQSDCDPEKKLFPFVHMYYYGYGIVE